MTDENRSRQEAIREVVGSIQKSYGEGAIMRLGETNAERVEVIPTGSLALDEALGIGGYPRGRAYLVKKLLKDLGGLTAWKTYAYFLGGAPALNTQTGVALRPLDDTSQRLRDEARQDRNMVIAFHIAMLAVMAWSGTLLEYLVLWILPLVTVVQAILRLRAIAEHGATTDLSSPLTAARTNVLPAWLEWLLFPHRVNYHIEHHLYASVPHYNLPRLHREMAGRGMLEGAEVVPFGATLGKMAIGLRVVTSDGQRLSFANATGRYFAKILSAIILLIGFIMIAFTDRKRGLHDMIAGTLVIKVR